MFLREMPGKTLSDVAGELNTSSVSWGGSTLNIEPHLTDDTPTFRLTGPGGNVEVPYTATGLEQLSTFTGIPTKFVERAVQQDKEYAQQVLQGWLRLNIDNVAVGYVPDEGIVEVYKPSQQRLQPRQLVERVSNVMGADAQIVEVINTPDLFRLDTIVGEGADYGWGGDRAVNDLSAGGLRVEYNRERNLAPSVSALLYRLACTNGYERYEDAWKIDIRGATVDQVLAEVEQKAQEVFGRVENELAAFYDLRNQPIEGDVTQAVIRIADERGLRPRVAHTLATRVPDYTDEQGHATMFDIVNLFTNAANEPSVRRSPTRSRTLELAGGVLIGEHVDRCGHCAQRLN